MDKFGLFLCSGFGCCGTTTVRNLLYIFYHQSSNPAEALVVTIIVFGIIEDI